MKRIILFCLIFYTVLLVGCNSLTSLKQRVFGKSSQQQAKIETKVDDLKDKQAGNDEKRLTHIGAWASGTERALDTVSNKEPAVMVAKETNERVLALAGKPDFEELKVVYNIVDTYMTNQANAQKMLAYKDLEIIKLNNQIKQNDLALQAQIKDAFTLADKNASDADTYRATLNSMNSWFGLGAISYGFKRLFTSAMWTIIIFLVVYFGLKVAASFNPIAGSIFAIFENIASAGLRMVKSLVSLKTFSLAGFTTTAESNSYRDTMTHLIDAIQVIRERKESQGKAYTIDDLMIEITKSNSWSDSDKKNVETIKKELNWK